jgi:anti-sigma regulatory factor (Ser/Thr protein kinase)
MNDKITLHYIVDGNDFMSAGEASSDVKRVLKKLGFDGEIIRKTSIAMYEGEINMVIHAGGGEADIEINKDKIYITLTDYGKGIENIDMAMQEGFSTAPDKVRSLGFGAGMGLPNMKKYSDEFYIESTVGKGTTVKMGIKVV